MTMLAMKATVARSAAIRPIPKVKKEGSLAVPLAPLRSMNKEVRKARNVNPVAIEFSVRMVIRVSSSHWLTNWVDHEDSYGSAGD